MDPRTAECAAAAARTGAERAFERARGPNRGQESDDQRHRERHRDNECQCSEIRCGVESRGGRRGRVAQDRSSRERHERDAAHRGDGDEERVLGHELLDNPRASTAERQPHRQLPSSSGGAGEQERADVRTGDEQHGRHAGHERVERLRELRAQGLSDAGSVGAGAGEFYLSRYGRGGEPERAGEGAEPEPAPVLG